MKSRLNSRQINNSRRPFNIMFQEDQSQNNLIETFKITRNPRIIMKPVVQNLVRRCIVYKQRRLCHIHLVLIGNDLSDEKRHAPADRKYDVMEWSFGRLLACNVDNSVVFEKRRRATSLRQRHLRHGHLTVHR